MVSHRTLAYSWGMRIFFVISMLFMLGFISVSAKEQGKVTNARKLKLVFFEDYAPFSMRNSKGQLEGILIDTLRELLEKRLRIAVELEGGPWIRMQKLVERGEADGFCTFPTEKRKKYTRVACRPVILAEYRIYTGKSNPKIKRLEKIKSLDELVQGALKNEYTVGSYLGSGWTKKNLSQRNVNVEYVGDQHMNIKKLAYNRVDVYVNNSIVQRYTMKLMNISDKIIELPHVLDSVPFHLCIRQTSPFVKYLDRMNQELKKMHQDGTIKKIIDSYTQ